MLHGDLGTSFRYNQGVTRLIAQRYPFTLQLTLASLFVAIMLAIPAGVPPPSAAIAGTTASKRSQPLRLVVPQLRPRPGADSFFPIELGWLPVSGAGSFAHLILPAITMGGALSRDSDPHGSHLHARRVRPGLHPHRPRQRPARAHGSLSPRPAQRHDPNPDRLRIAIRRALAGAIVTETIFSWPGIGRLTIQAISNRDYYLVQGCILAIGLTYVAVNFLTDLLYSVVNPRIQAVTWPRAHPTP